MSDTVGDLVDPEMRAIIDYIRVTGPEQHEYVADQHVLRLAEDARWLANNCDPADRIVDIGSFPWFVPSYLSAKGFTNVNTVDIARPDVFAKSPEWQFDSSTLDIEAEALPFEDDSVDVVVLFEIFEHLYRRPNFVLREVVRILKPGGRVVLSTPNGTHIPTLMRFLTRRELGPSLYDASAVYERLGHFSHLREYSIQELRRYLKNFGLRVTQERFRACWTKGPPPLVLKVAISVAPTLADNIFLVAEL